MVSSDRNIFTSGSSVSERMKEYGALVEEVHIVVLSDNSHGLKEKKLGENVWVYPTNSSSKFLRPFDAATIGKSVVLKNKFVRGLSLVTAQDPFECGWAGVKIKTKWRIPLEVQLHTDPFSENFSGFANFVRRRLYKKVMRKADAVRVVSKSLAQRLKIENPKLKINVLPIYIDRERIESGQIGFDIHTRYPWHFIILMVCRLAPEKNIPLAFRILSELRKNYPDTGLLIVGSGVEKERLKARVKKMGLEGAVEFAGWQEDLASFYRTANVFLQTSQFEGYGLSLVEAGLSGLPVVTTPVGIASELTPGQDAYIYPTQSPEQFVMGLADLIEHNQKRENLRLNLKKTLESKLLSKEEYLEKLKDSWEETSKKVK